MKPAIFLIFLSALVCFSEAVDQTCGSGPRPSNSRIIGGSAVSQDIPWHVAIFKGIYVARYFCGGAIINNQWVVTSASCVNGSRPFEMVIRYGTRDIRTGPYIRGQSIIMHESYQGRPTGWADDIALIKLASPLNFTSNVGSICMPGTAAPPGSTVKLSGYGVVETGRFPRALTAVDVPVSTFEKCKETYSWVDSDRFMCAGDDGQGACIGDVGGPMSYYKNGRWELQGIITFGRRSCLVRRDTPQGFTRVSHYVDWIRSKCGCV